MKTKRMLVAIMFTEILGYSKLTSEMEQPRFWSGRQVMCYPVFLKSNVKPLDEYIKITNGQIHQFMCRFQISIFMINGYYQGVKRLILKILILNPIAFYAELVI